MKKTFNADTNALDHVRKLQAYVPGEQPQGEGWVKLNTNENPYPPSPKVAEAIAGEVEKLRRGFRAPEVWGGEAVVTVEA